MSNPSVITPELIGQLSLTPDGQYYTGAVNEEFFAFSTDEVVSVLGDAYGADPEGEARALATQTVAKNGGIKPGVLGPASAYVEKISDTSKSQSPLEDYEIYQSVNTGLLKDPKATPEDKAYVTNILKRKMKAHKYAKDNEENLSPEKIGDAQLLANTAVDEIDYAGPGAFEGILADGDPETQEAVLVFTQGVLKGDLKGEVNEVSEESKEDFANVAYKIVTSESVQDVDADLVVETREALVVYYTEHEDVAAAQGIDLNELVDPQPLNTDSDSNPSDAAAPGANQMGIASTGSDGAENAAHVDPIAQTTASLRPHNDVAGDEIKVPSVSPTETAELAVADNEIDLPAPIPASSVEPVHSPMLIASGSSEGSIDKLPEMNFWSVPLAALSRGLSALFPHNDGPTAGRPDNSAPTTGNTLPPVGAENTITALNEAGARAVHLDPPVEAIASPVSAKARARNYAANAGFFGTPAFIGQEGGVFAWFSASESADANTVAERLAVNPLLAVAGAQSLPIPLVHLARSTMPVTIARSKGPSGNASVDKLGSQADGGAHHGNGEDRHRDRDGKGQGRNQEDARHAWYDTDEAEPEPVDGKSKAA